MTDLNLHGFNLRKLARAALACLTAAAIAGVLLAATAAWAVDPTATPTVTPTEGPGCCACGGGTDCGGVPTPAATPNRCSDNGGNEFDCRSFCGDCGFIAWVPGSALCVTGCGGNWPTPAACVVNSTLDTDCATPTPTPGGTSGTNKFDLKCDDGDGNCTLRCAFTATTQLSCRDRSVTFSISGGGPHTIPLGSPLPQGATGEVPVTIDCTTQAGSACGSLWAPTPTPPALKIVIDGTGSTGPFLHTNDAILVQGCKFINWPSTPEVAILGEFITGTAVVRCNWFDNNAVPNIQESLDSGNDVLIGGTSAGDGNVFTNTGEGQGAVIINRNVVVKGNWFGVDPSTGALATNDTNGILVTGDGITNVAIGGSGNSRNLIAASKYAGINIEADASGVTVSDNLVGVAPGGGQDDAYCNCAGIDDCTGEGLSPPAKSQIWDQNDATLSGNTVGDCATPTPTVTATPTDTPGPTSTPEPVLTDTCCAVTGPVSCIDATVGAGPFGDISQCQAVLDGFFGPGVATATTYNGTSNCVPEGDTSGSCPAMASTATPTATPTPTPGVPTATPTTGPTRPPCNPHRHLGFLHAGCR